MSLFINNTAGASTAASHESKASAGFSLIELMVTITIMGIVMAISTLSFNSWTTKSNIEKQIRELFTDLSEARTKAFTQKKLHRIVFQPTSYVLKTYSTENETKTAGSTITTKNLKYGLTSKNASGSNLAVDITDYFVEFDSRGLASNNFTVIVNPLSADTSVNCVVIYDTRANIGKINGTNCEFR
ncbi:MAG: prepilin-type N-terminal cleavage/methylation domain-containing protein [Deltaproteobacteria bacterium]